MPIFGYRPSPTAQFPAWLNEVTPPCLLVAGFYFIFGITLFPFYALFAGIFIILMILTIVKWVYHLPRFHRPAVPVGAI